MKHANDGYRRIQFLQHAPYFLVSVILVACVMASKVQAATSWNLEKVQEPRYFRINQRSMVIDAAGNPHIFYGGNHLYHSYFNGSQWQRETIDPAPRTGRAATVAMDSSGKFHVLYEDNYKQAVNYATNASGSWLIESLTVSAMPTIGMRGWYAIAVDSSGRPHIGYYNGTKVAHAVKLSTGWQSDTVDDGGYVDGRGDISMAIDGGNHVHMVYHYSTIEQNLYPNYIKHATNASGSWVSEKIDSRSTYQAISFEHNSLVLDSNGRAHVAYLGFDSSLYYANNVNGAWIVQSIDSHETSGYYPSIVLDSNGKAHVSYISTTPYPATASVSYATNRSGVWVTQLLETSSSNFSAYTTLGINASGSIHITYFDVGTLGIRYLTNRSNNWIATSLDTSEESVNPTTTPIPNPVGAFSSIARDTHGKLHVSYIKSHFDTLNSSNDGVGVLMYANNVSGSWITQGITPSTGFETIQQSTIAVDANDKAHVAYFSGSDINYATNRNGTWVLIRLEQAYRIYGLPHKIGIAIDNLGSVHIAYFVQEGAGGNASGKLRYATNRSGTWQIETVTIINPDLGYSLASDVSASLAIDSNGHAHIGYLDGSGNVTYAANISGSWAIKIIALIDKTHRWGAQSMVVQPSGTVHMAFQSLNCASVCYERGIEYATNAGGVWQREIVDDGIIYSGTNYSGMHSPALAMDGNGKPHISYWYYETQYYLSKPVAHNLRYATKLEMLWRPSIIENNFNIGEQNALTSDNNGNVFISYNDEPNGALKLASSQQVPSPLINVIMSPDNPDFGNVSVSSQVSRLITIQNLGQNALNISSIALSGNSAFAMDFAAGQKPCGVSTNLTLQARAECTLVLLFNPSTAGLVTATMTVNSNDPELPVLAGDVTGAGISSSSGSAGGGSGGGGGGGGCSITETADVDPTLISLLMLSFIQLLRRRLRQNDN